MTAKRKTAPKRSGAELGALLDAGVADDRQAMEALYHAAAPALYGRARAAVEGPAADAALVAAFLEIFATARGRDTAASPAAWLAAVLDRHLLEGATPPRASVAPVQPPPEVWQRLDIAIGLKRLDRHVKPGVATMARGRDPMPNEVRKGQDKALRLWRMAALSASAVALALALVLLGDRFLPPAVETPAEAAPGAGTEQDRVALLQPLAPGRVWRVGLAGNQLSVTPLPPLVLTDDRVLRLWAMPDPDGTPQALGSLDGGRTTTLELPDEYEAAGLGLGVSVESAEAPPMALPTAPFLFYGRLLP